MPSADDILQALRSLANKYMIVATLWHIAFVLILFFALFSRQKPSNRLTGYLLSLPIFSVSFFAWQIHNPFNGSVFFIVAVLLLFFTHRQKPDTIRVNPIWWIRTVGIIVFLSGLFYPHFLGSRLLVYLYASPVGLVPCPTLLTLSGFAMIFNTKQSNSWMVTLIAVDIFYGFFGFLRLEVYLDILLVIASLGLIIQTVQTKVVDTTSYKKMTRLIHHE